MKHAVITMTDDKYFDYGRDFYESRENVNADFYCFSPNLNKFQESLLADYDIRHIKVSEKDFYNRMQMLKFYYVLKALEMGYDTVTFCDFDTFFKKDFINTVYSRPFDIGLTTRNEFIQKNRCARAWSNGGVFFVRNAQIMGDAIECVKMGGDSDLPDYDAIWKTLEDGRKPEKTHSRKNHRWWVDQIWMSAVVMRTIANQKYKDYKVELFHCEEFNHLNGTPDDGLNYYIGHLKNKGAPVEFKDAR